MSHNLKRRPDPLSLFVHNDCVVLSELFTVCDSSCSIKSCLRGYISCHFLNELFLLWLSFCSSCTKSWRRHCSRGRSNMTAGCVAQVRVKRKIDTGCFGLIYVGVYRDRQVAVKHLHRSVKHTRATLESTCLVCKICSVHIVVNVQHICDRPILPCFCIVFKRQCVSKPRPSIVMNVHCISQQKAQLNARGGRQYCPQSYKYNHTVRI